MPATAWASSPPSREIPHPACRTAGRSAFPSRTYPRELRALYRYVFDPGRFRPMTTPTLILVGDAGPGPSFFRKASETLHAALKDSRIVVLEGQGHMAIF